MSTLTKEDIEIATRAAEHFTRLYYTAYDSPTRVDDLPNFYRPHSAMTWNGNPYGGADAVRELISKMPKTKHEVHSYDCHPIPGSQPPSLLITVTGSVVHGGGPTANPVSTPSKSIDGQPRVFTQTFILSPDVTATKTAGEVAKYYITADTMRFVG
ncbi:NTF2-like protein [Dentipellis sp. KUC8613]|nr:NTF2-like protein [Dentipellis sp. KUC8613]